MAQDQELIGLQNELAKNLNLQENLKLAISLKEQALSTLEIEQEIIERDILHCQGNVQGNKESFNILNDIANDMLQGINVDLDKNEQGETIQ